jgi:hypothetical protein
VFGKEIGLYQRFNPHLPSSSADSGKLRAYGFDGQFRFAEPGQLPKFRCAKHG